MKTKIPSRSTEDKKKKRRSARPTPRKYKRWKKWRDHKGKSKKETNKTKDRNRNINHFKSNKTKVFSKEEKKSKQTPFVPAPLKMKPNFYNIRKPQKKDNNSPGKAL